MMGKDCVSSRRNGVQYVMIVFLHVKRVKICAMLEQYLHGLEASFA
jgi:hypothetical protein